MSIQHPDVQAREGGYRRCGAFGACVSREGVRPGAWFSRRIPCLLLACLLLFGFGAMLVAGEIPRPDGAVMPVFAISDTPLKEVAQILAKSAKLNLVFDASLAAGGAPAGSPLGRDVKLHLEKVTPGQALEALLKQNQLVLVWRPEINVAFVRGAAETSGTPALAPPPMPPSANTNLLPEVVVDEPSIQDACLPLMREAGLNYIFDAVVLGKAPGPDGKTLLLPKTELRLENVTPVQVVAAILDAQGLVGVWNESLKILRITTRQRYALELTQMWKQRPWTPPDRSALAPQMVLLLDEAPLAEVLDTFSQQMGMKFVLDAALAEQLKTGQAGNGLPAAFEAKFRNVSLQQAFLAVLDALGLASEPDTASGLLRVGWKQDFAAEPRQPESLLPADVGVGKPVDKIAFADLAFGEAVATLAQMARVPVVCMPQLLDGAGQVPLKLGELKVSFSIEKTAPRQALLAFLAAHRCALLWHEPSKVGFVASRRDAARVFASLGRSAEVMGKIAAGGAAAGAKNGIDLDAKPLNEHLSDLAVALGLKLNLDPSVKDGLAGPGDAAGSPKRWPLVEFHAVGNQNPSSVLGALLDGAGLAAVFDGGTKTLTVKTP